MGMKSSLLFNLIAPIYGLFYDYQVSRYVDLIDKAYGDLNLVEYDTVLDVGCGTGALCAALDRRGFSVTGIDTAKGMIGVAKRKNRRTGARFIRASVLDGLPFDDKSFDVSIASYVAHGLPKEERRAMYGEMSRVSSHLVILYDYNGNRSILTDMIEWLEGGDYFNFIENARHELGDYFGNIRIIEFDSRSSLYVCEPLNE